MGVAIIGDRDGLNPERKAVLNTGYMDIVESANLNPVRLLPEDIEKVKAFLSTDKDPMWFLDYCEFRWMVLS